MSQNVKLAFAITLVIAAALVALAAGMRLG
jgi:hypothetical protein